VRGLILASLERSFGASLASDLVSVHEKLVTEYRRGNAEGALVAAGKFVEHTLRAIEFLRTGTAPSEIKSISSTVKAIEAETKLPESLRILVPRIASALSFDLRSKRGAAHVKEIDPRNIDAALAAQASAWIVAEFIRLFHVDDEDAVAEAMVELMAGNLPLIEKFGDEVVVTTPLRPDVEVLLMIAESEPTGIDRKGLGICVKQSPVAVTRALQKLDKERYVHRTKDGAFRITGPGERFLLGELASHGCAPLPPKRV
jgi:hypothetical protein